MSIRGDEISAFWRWFTKEQAAVMAIHDADSESWNCVEKQLQSIDESLRFEVSGADDRPRDFVVTAGGQVELFPLVEETVAAAPDLSDWRFLALKPEMGFDFTTRYEDLHLDPQTMWFLPLDNSANPKVLGLRIGIPELEDSHKPTARAALPMMLETGLGERAAAEEVAHIEVVPLPEAPEDHGYIELPDLATYIAWRKSKNRA